jgi:type I restriction enzyme S subunit
MKDVSNSTGFQMPADWKQTTLGELFDIQQGKALNKKARQGKAPRAFLRTANVFWGHVDLSKVDEMDFSEEEVRRLCLQAGDLLTCEGGDVGRTAIWRGELPLCCYQNHLHRLRAKSADVEPEFFMRWMEVAICQFDLYRGASNKTTIPNLSKSRLASFVVPHPPLPEQRAIAEVLRTVQQAKEATEKIIAATKELKKSLMRHLFTYGPVQIDQADQMRLKETEIGPMPEHWKVARVQELCEEVTVGVVVRPASYYVPEGIPAFRSLNIREDALETRDLVFFSKEANDGRLAKSKLRAGDVLVVRTGYPGTSCVVPPRFEGANCIDLVIARPNTEFVRSDFLSRFFNSAQGRSQALTAQTGLAQQHLNVGAVKRTIIPLPPTDEQESITSALGCVDSKLSSELRRRSAMDTLFQSLLHHLMTGKVQVDHLTLG